MLDNCDHWDTDLHTDGYAVKRTDGLPREGLEVVEPSGLDKSLLKIDLGKTGLSARPYRENKTR